MEEVFHHIRIDKNELKKVKEISRKKKSHKPMETEDFIPFDFEEIEPEQIKEKDEDKSSKGKDSKPLPSKRSKIETLLYKGMPWLDQGRKYDTNTAQRLHQEIVDFVNWMGPTEEERYARQSCITRVEKIILSAWKDAIVKAYGSVRTQFYVPSSDIDLVVMLSDNDTQKLPLKRLAKLIDNASLAEKGSIQVISKARVPIIKYIDRISAYPVDISFNTVSGTESGDLITKFSSQFPALRPLTLVLKQFLEMRGLNEVYTGGIGSYTVTCLVLSFLQTHPLIQNGIIRPHENLGVMLLEIFELYGKHFNYDNVGISVQPVETGEFYYDKIERGWVNESRPGLLSIEDPQNPENDISKGSFSFHMVRQAFDHGFNVLSAAMLEFEKVLLDYHRSSKSSSHPRQYSILASIVRISNDVLRHRHYVQSITNL